MFSGTLTAQEIGPTLTKAEAFEQMLESNFGIQIARNNVSIAENNKSILNANYLKHLLSEKFEILYTGEHGNVAHEMILDTREFKRSAGIEAEDIAKRLMD